MSGDGEGLTSGSGPGGTALAFAAHLGAHVLSDDEVVLLSERDRFALNGRVHAALAPLLDGSRSADDLAAELADEHPPAHIHLALTRLRRSGVVVDTAPSRDSRVAGTRDTPALPVSARPSIAPPATTVGPVVAIGIPQAWADRLQDTVGARAGGNEQNASLTVCLVDDYLRPELGAAVADGVATGGSLLVVRPVGRWLWFGPLLVGPASIPMWSLFDERMRMNRFADVVALEHDGSLPLFPDDRSAATIALALAVTGDIVAAILDGTPPSELLDGMLTYDTVDETFARHVVAQVAPPRRDDAPEFGHMMPPIRIGDAPTHFSEDGGHRTCTPGETLARLDRLVSPVTGIISSVDPVPGIGGMHVFSAAHPQAPVVTRPRGRALGRKGGAMGKGFLEDQARVSCIGEAIEHYSGGFFGDEPRRRARLADIAEIAFHPEELLLYSDAQYAAGASVDEQAADSVPSRFDSAQEIEWVPVSSLISGETRWLPAAYCYYGYGASDVGGYGGPTYCVADSNGCASGNTIEEAILQGLMELLERDACGIAWYNRARRPEIELESFADEQFAPVREAFTRRGRDLHVLDLRTDTEVAVALAVACSREDGLATRFALGCHLDPRIAVSRSLSELAQLEVEDPESDVAGDAEPFAAASIRDQPHLMPSDRPPVRAGELPDLSRSDIAEELHWGCDMLARLGHDVLVLDQTRPEVGFPTVRVIVPGLRHFWRRLAPGRLYDVPVALGWAEAPLREDELNPLSVLI